MNFNLKTTLRRIGLPLLRLFATDIRIKHPFVTSLKFTLNSYKHKGYWFYRKRREQKTMVVFSNIIDPGMQIAEVGGHIGFISIYFMHLVGSAGKLFVFEPGANNLPYIRKNLKASEQLGVPYQLIEEAAGNEIGEVRFFEDALTGQNNSAVEEFDGLKRNAEAAFTNVVTTERVVPLTTLDSVFSDEKIDFIKVDVEGFEKNVILGSEKLIDQHRPMLMVEIQADEQELYDFFTLRDYQMYSEDGKKISDPTRV